MEDITRQKFSFNSISASTPKLAMHTDSHIISKLKPKVRIIHIFAPEIIKTDVANFRELVQRLTGKPGDDLDHLQTSSNRKNKKARNPPAGCKKLMMKKKSSNNASFPSSESSKKNMQFQDYGLSSLIQEEKLKRKEENEVWGSSGENSRDIFDGFGDFNGFIDLSDGNVLLTTPQISHMDVFGDLHFA